MPDRSRKPPKIRGGVGRARGVPSRFAGGGNKSLTVDVNPLKRISTLEPLLLPVLLCVAISAYLIISRGFTPQARILPSITAGPTLVIAMFLVIQESKGILRRHRGDGDQRVKFDVSPASAGGEASHYRSERNALLWFMAFAGGYYLAGHLIAAALSTFYVRFYGRSSWMTSVMYAAILGSVLHIGFILLGAPVYPGRFPLFS